MGKDKSGPTIIDPLVDGIIGLGKLSMKALYKLLNIKEYYNLEEYFKIVEFKNKKNVYPNLIKIYTSAKGYTYLFNIPIGLNVNDFKKHKEGIESQLKENVDIRIKSGFIEIEVIEKKLSSNIPYQLPKRTKDSIYIPIGESIEGPIGINLADNPHSYIVGTTGSGKSVCTKGIICSLVNNYSSEEVELFLCDLTMVELALFRFIKHTKKFVYEVSDTTEIIADLLNETLKRYSLFMSKGVTNIFEYNKLPGVEKLKYQVLLIEEAVILLEDNSKKAMKLLKRLICISRKSGCYVIMTTQRPSNDIIDAVVKAQISNRIVFAVEDEKNSIICLDSPEAKDLSGKGHGILKVGPNKTEFQSYFITDNQVNQYTKDLVVKNTKSIDFSDSNKPIKDKTLKPGIEKLQNICEESEDIAIDLSFLDNL